MSSADAQIVYNRHGSSGSSESVEAQDSFAQQFDLANPEEAMSSYQKIMHQHTMQQFESASALSRRRSKKNASLKSEDSHGSVGSTAS